MTGPIYVALFPAASSKPEENTSTDGYVRMPIPQGSPPSNGPVVAFERLSSDWGEVEVVDCVLIPMDAEIVLKFDEQGEQER